MTVEGQLWDNIRWNSVCLIGVPEGTENVLNLGKKQTSRSGNPESANKMNSKDPHPKTSCN